MCCDKGQDCEKQEGDEDKEVVVVKLRTPPAFWEALRKVREEIESEEDSETGPEDQPNVIEFPHTSGSRPQSD